MTYIISLALMVAGLVLLTWTFAAAVRLRREQDAVSIPNLPSAYALPVSGVFESAMANRGEADAGIHDARLSDTRFEASRAHSPRSNNAPSSDWYQLQCKASRGVRYAPDMGGFTEVPLQLQDAYDNRMYVRKRIWVN